MVNPLANTKFRNYNKGEAIVRLAFKWGVNEEPAAFIIKLKLCQ